MSEQFIQTLPTNEIPVETKPKSTVEAVRDEIADLSSLHANVAALRQKLLGAREEVVASHGEYKAELERILSSLKTAEEVTDNGERTAIVTGQELNFKAKADELRKVKQEVSDFLKNRNPYYADTPGLNTLLLSLEQQLKGKIVQLSADTPEGRAAWTVSYPTGAFHKETPGEQAIKAQEPKLREIYHSIGDQVDAQFKGAISEFNSPEVRFADDAKLDRHIMHRSPVLVDGSTVTFNFGQALGLITYELTRDSQGSWKVGKTRDYDMVGPKDFIHLVNRNMEQAERLLRQLAQNLN